MIYDGMSVPRGLFPAPAALRVEGERGGFYSSTRRRRGKARQSFYASRWATEALHGLNWLCGRDVSSDFEAISLGQNQGIQLMNARIKALAGPPCAPAAALAELCQSDPGCDCGPVKSVACTEGRMSLPSDESKCASAEFLAGHPREVVFRTVIICGRDIIVQMPPHRSYDLDSPKHVQSCCIIIHR